VSREAGVTEPASSTTLPPAVPATRALRRGYIDWLRGLAVLIMIEAHTLDAWTRTPDRVTFAFGRAMTIGGFGAPLFLFLAGIAVALSGATKAGRMGRRRAGAALRRRGWQIFALAFLFRLQAFVLSPGSPPGALLKVDILNIMGLAIVLAGWIWEWAGSARAQLLAFSAATAAVAMLTPIVRTTPLLNGLPDPIEWYVRPAPGRTNFVLFPWLGFLLAGGAVGALLSSTRDRRAEGQANAAVGIAGALIAAGGYLASLLPSIYASASFWTSSPTFFFVRLGILMAALAASYAWAQRRTGDRWSPMQEFGRVSLFIYWIHVELAYGLVSYPIHRRLPIEWAIAAFALFTIFLFALGRLKTTIGRRWKEAHVRPTARVAGLSR